MMPAIVNSIYQLAMGIGSFIVMPFFLLHPRGRVNFLERLGRWDWQPREVLWFHGASLGEMNGLIPLLRAVRHCGTATRAPAATGEYHPLATLVTVTSPTALPAVRAESDEAHILPFDFNPWFNRALGQARVRALVITETELWPGLLRWCERRSIPVYLVNGRISDHSWPRYRRARALFAPLLRSLRRIVAGDRRSAERFIALGAAADRVRVLGNTKYDADMSEPALTREQARSFFARSDRPLVVLGSLRPGEEQLWLPVLAGRLAELNVVIAPRHRERFDYFADALRRSAIPYVKRSNAKSSEQAAVAEGSILLLDTFGELLSFYGAADLAFVGGTLCDVGGHNPLEPAALGVPVCFGPSVSNVAEVCEALLAGGGAVQIRSRGEIAELLDRLLEHPDALAAIGRRGQAVWHASRGASERVVELLKSDGVL